MLELVAAQIEMEGNRSLSGLAQQADEAFAAGNRERCTRIIAELYQFFDEQLGIISRVAAVFAVGLTS